MSNNIQHTNELPVMKGLKDVFLPKQLRLNLL